MFFYPKRKYNNHMKEGENLDYLAVVFFQLWVSTWKAADPCVRFQSIDTPDSTTMSAVPASVRARQPGHPGAFRGSR